mgnify:FL=1|jgi:hypothetical protein
MIEGTHLEHWIDSITIGTWLPNEQDTSTPSTPKKKKKTTKKKKAKRGWVNGILLQE